MKRRDFMKALAVAGAAFVIPGLGRGAAAARPRNVVFIMADDVGWGDLGCYGAQKIKTPNLDTLARAGMRFTDVHACPLCSATRYGLLSGDYNFRHDPPPVVMAPSAPLALRLDRPNLASVMKSAGYATGIVGKWHLGLGETQGGQNWNGELKPGPLEIGFDYWFGYATTNDRTPCVYIENHKVVGLDPADPIAVSDARSEPGMSNIVGGTYRHTSQSGGKAALWKDEEMSDVLTGKAVKFIEEHKDKPFFLYYSTVDVHHPLIPHPRFRGTSQAGTRGDGVQELDSQVGEVLKTLDRLGLAEDTLLIFTSDNGPSTDNQFRDLNKDPIDWDKVYPRGDQESHNGAGPWNGKKGSQLEGGHREPFIVRWPAQIKTGQVSEVTFGLVDMVATFAAMTGQELPRDVAVDSFNAWPALLEAKPAKPVRDHLVIGLPGLSIRVGDWKLIAAGVGNPGQAKGKKKAGGKAGGKAANAAGGPQLYNLKDDPGEINNLAAQHPEKVKELADRLQKIRDSGRSRP